MPDIDENNNKVQIPTAAHDEIMDILDLPHTLLKGTLGMREAGQTYLPQEEEETDPAYENRLARSILLEAYKRTLQKLTGEVFGKDITLGEDVFEEFKEALEDDIDRNGKSLSRFARNVFYQGIGDGASHILIDHPAALKRRTTEGMIEYGEKVEGKEEPVWSTLTKQIEKEKSWRPYWVLIKVEDIIGWRMEMVDGQNKLVQLRLRETKEEPVGDYGTEDVERIRVLTPGRWEVWEKKATDEGSDKETKYEMVDFGITNLDFIPLVTFMPGEKLRELTARPPLEGLAWLNLMHWQSSSDQRNILHYARMVTYFGKMLAIDPTQGKLILGSNRITYSEDPDGDLKVVEHTGKGIEAGRQDLKDLETQMSLFGLTYMMPKTGNITATEKAIDSSENDSALEGWALIFQDAVNTAIDYTGQMVGKKHGESGKAKVNTEIGSVLSDQSADILLKAFQMGLLPRQLIIDEFKQRGLIKTEADFLEILAMLEEDKRSGLDEMSGFIPGGEPEEKGITEKTTGEIMRAEKRRKKREEERAKKKAEKEAAEAEAKTKKE